MHYLSAWHGLVQVVDTGGRFAIETIVVRVSITVGIGITVVSGMMTVVSGVKVVGISFGISLSLTFAFSSAGNRLVQMVDTRGRFATQTQTVVAMVGIGIPSVSVSQSVVAVVVSSEPVVSTVEDSGVGLGLSLGISGSDNSSEQDLKKGIQIVFLLLQKFVKKVLTKAFMFLLQREAPSRIN